MLEMAKKITVKTGNKEVTVNVGDKIKYTCYRDSKVNDTNLEYFDIVEVKKAATTKGNKVVTEEYQYSSFVNIHGELNIKGEQDYYNVKRHLNGYENGNGIKYVNENKWEHYSDGVLTYVAERFQ
jgi:hypothetical protein